MSSNYHNKNSTKCQTILKLKVTGRQTKQTRTIRSEEYTQTGRSSTKWRSRDKHILTSGTLKTYFNILLFYVKRKKVFDSILLSLIYQKYNVYLYIPVLFEP